MKFLSYDGLIYFWENVKNYIDEKYEQTSGGSGGGGSHIGTTAPSDTKLLWVDTGNGGILKYHNGTAWVAVKSVWG